jgi:hypothetical protein
MFSKNGRNILPPKDRAARIKAIRREVIGINMPKIESCGIVEVNVLEDSQKPKNSIFEPKKQ